MDGDFIERLQWIYLTEVEEDLEKGQRVAIDVQDSERPREDESEAEDMGERREEGGGGGGEGARAA